MIWPHPWTLADEFFFPPAVKRLKKEADLRNGISKPTKKRVKKKPRDSNSEDMAATPAESAKQMLQRRSYSKKINYKAIEGLFEDD